MLRQFVEVIRIQELPGGEDLYQRLVQESDRFRAGGATSTPPQREAAEEPGRLPILIHLADPSWVPDPGIRGLSLGSRLRTVVTAHAGPEAIAALLRDPLVISIEESRPVDPDYESEPPLQFIGATGEYADTIGSFSEKGAGALIAIIDDGIDVLHEAFLDDQQRSRIVGIWDQRDGSGSPPSGFDYGCYHTERDIDAYVKARSAPGTLTRNPDGHGTHVASIAAGRAVGAFQGGVAPEASLLVVIARLDGDIGYSKAHVDALAFIDRVATERAMPVVVNVSKGTNAGAHDGKSAVEVAFDEFAGGGRKPGRVVIKSAGNERGFNRHAAVGIGAGDEAWLPWTRHQGASSRFERVELWWDSSDILQFRLGHPDGSWTEWVTEQAPNLAGSLGAGGEFHLQLTRLHVDNGDNQLRVEIGGATGGVCSGTWTVHIKAVAVSSGQPIHAWIERGGPAASGFTDWARPEMTLTVPGTSDTVITVGAVASNGSRLGQFSSFGPTRDDRKKPDLVAPGIGVIAARGGTDRDVRPESGTSMAAPHVAGAVALAFSRSVTLKRRPATASQIRAALTRKTRNFNGHHDVGRGYGVLDISKFLAAF
jgi:endonuclease G